MPDLQWFTPNPLYGRYQVGWHNFNENPTIEESIGAGDMQSRFSRKEKP